MVQKEIVRKAAETYCDYIEPPYCTMVSLGGFEAVYALLNDYGSSDLYIPTVKKVFGKCMEKDLIARYDGTNAKQLAKEYGFSDRHVHNLIKRKDEN